MSQRLAFASRYNVPRGTMAKFDMWADLLADWQTRHNLVGRSTMNEVWERHFADSAQLVEHLEPDAVTVDLGSGAGLPGLVLALLRPGNFHLVEATSKKCRFLEAVVAALELGDRVTVHNSRVEALAPLSVDCITSRACAHLRQLFDWGLPHGNRARWLLLKGRSAAAEVADARRQFSFSAELFSSATDPSARIVVAHSVARR